MSRVAYVSALILFGLSYLAAWKHKPVEMLVALVGSCVCVRAIGEFAPKTSEGAS